MEENKGKGERKWKGGEISPNNWTKIRFMGI